MGTRAAQREETRDRIVEAAVSAFSELGFGGASTREIASRAGTNQGLITYHFRSKDELWRAAADRLFERLETHLSERLPAPDPDDPRSAAREAVREYVRFAAAHPELFRFLIDAGRVGDERMQWLVDTHIAPRFEDFRRFSGPDFDDSMLPHAYYAMAGAGSVMFAVAPECRRLTGLDPETEQAIETHAEFVARLLVP